MSIFRWPPSQRPLHTIQHILFSDSIGAVCSFSCLSIVAQARPRRLVRIDCDRIWMRTRCSVVLSKCHFSFECLAFGVGVGMLFGGNRLNMLPWKRYLRCWQKPKHSAWRLSHWPGCGDCIMIIRYFTSISKCILWFSSHLLSLFGVVHDRPVMSDRWMRAEDTQNEFNKNRRFFTANVLQSFLWQPAAAFDNELSEFTCTFHAGRVDQRINHPLVYSLRHGCSIDSLHFLCTCFLLLLHRMGVVARQSIQSNSPTSRWCIINYYTNCGSVTFECFSILIFLFSRRRSTTVHSQMTMNVVIAWQRWMQYVIKKTGDNNPHIHSHKHIRRRSQLCNGFSNFLRAAPKFHSIIWFRKACMQTQVVSLASASTIVCALCAVCF